MPRPPRFQYPGAIYHLCSATTRFPHRFGLSYPDSASDLIRRGTKRIEQSTEAVRQQTAIEKKLKLNPESRADPGEALYCVGSVHVAACSA